MSTLIDGGDGSKGLLSFLGVVSQRIFHWLKKSRRHGLQQSVETFNRDVAEYAVVTANGVNTI
ncbi:MAG: hypothetical protein ABW157_14045 [Candidatus Thiodiazotropha sp. LLP2]